MAATNALVATLLAMAGQRNVLVIPRAFVQFTGSIESAMMLNQLLYWMPRGHNDGFIYKTDREWQDELYLTRYAVRSARDRLVEMGFLQIKITRSGIAPTAHYYLDYDRLVDLWSQWLESQNGLSENEQSDCPKTNNPLSENEQSIVRKRTNMNHRVPTEITTEEPPPPTPSAKPMPIGGGGGSVSVSIPEPTEKTATERWLLSEGFGSASEFRDLDLAVVQADVARRRAAGQGEGAIVSAWRAQPPTARPTHNPMDGPWAPSDFARVRAMLGIAEDEEQP